MTETQCAELVYSQFGGGNQCPNKGKVQEAGKWWCGIHSPEAKRKRDAKQKARWAEHDAETVTRQTRLEEDDRKLTTYPALAESHTALMGVFSILVNTDEAADHMARRYGVGVAVIEITRKTLTKARALMPEK